MAATIRPLRPDDHPGIRVETHRGPATLLAIYGEFCWLKYDDWDQPDTLPMTIVHTLTQ